MRNSISEKKAALSMNMKYESDGALFLSLSIFPLFSCRCLLKWIQTNKLHRWKSLFFSVFLPFFSSLFICGWLWARYQALTFIPEKKWNKKIEIMMTGAIFYGSYIYIYIYKVNSGKEITNFAGNAHTRIELGIVYWFTFCFMCGHDENECLSNGTATALMMIEINRAVVQQQQQAAEFRSCNWSA